MIKKMIGVSDQSNNIIGLLTKKRLAVRDADSRVQIWMEPGDIRLVGNDRYAALSRDGLHKDKHHLTITFYSLSGAGLRCFGNKVRPIDGSYYPVTAQNGSIWAQALAIQHDDLGKPNRALIEFTVYNQEASNVRSL